ncbi:MAG: hypothetical protein QOI76_1860 [Frankiales bacterium]|nr:hypothetical protein [Frankiales bacterium]
MHRPACLALSGDEQLGKPPKGPMSVNLKGRKNAQSEQAVPAPELVMAGGQTPWGSDAPPSGNPFAEPAAVTGMPTMPPPPPPAPGEEAEADAPSGRKAPNRNMIIALAAVVVLGGGGYAYSTMGSSSPASTPVVKHVPLPGSPAAKAAALRAAAAAKAAAAGKAAPAAAKPTGGKPAAAKPATNGKPPAAKPATGGKASTKPATPAKTPVTAPVAAGTPETAALPGRIGEWSKLVSVKVTDPLAKTTPDVGSSLTNVQSGYFGNSDLAPSLFVMTGDHKTTTKTGLQLLRSLVPTLKDGGMVVAAPVAVSHAPYGGTAACTTAAKDDSLTVICAWVDDNTFGVMSAYHRAQSQAGDILANVRGSIEH